MDQIDLHIAKQIKKYRLLSKLTRTEMAGMMGFKSHVSITNMEQGKQSFMPKSIYMFCCIFNITPDALFPKIQNAKIEKQVKKVTIKPKVFNVSGLPVIK